MGIGFIPFDRVTAGGLADTSVDPSYFFQVHQVPFGGPLPLMINHLRAFHDGASYYRVKVDGVVHTDAWTDYRWNSFNYVVQTIGTVSVARAQRGRRGRRLSGRPWGHGKVRGVPYADNAIRPPGQAGTVA
jgi:hypothetical protein